MTGVKGGSPNTGSPSAEFHGAGFHNTKFNSTIATSPVQQPSPRPPSVAAIAASAPPQNTAFRRTTTAHRAQPAANAAAEASHSQSASVGSVTGPHAGFRQTIPHQTDPNRPHASRTHNNRPHANHTDDSHTAVTPHRTGLTDQVIEAATHGQTPRMIARALDQPLDLVDLIIERERAAGHITIYDLTSCNSTTGAGCNPDPESMVCASCPILPRQIRKNQSLFGRLKARLR